jgi:hypothetical protein
MSGRAHADLHCDVVVTARWVLPGQVLVNVEVGGGRQAEHVLAWLADPGFRAQFAGGPGARVVAARGQREHSTWMSGDRYMAWVDIPAPEVGGSDLLEFHVAAAHPTPGRRIGRVVVTQRDEDGPGEDVAWALSATFDLHAAAGPSPGEGVDVGPATYSLVAAVTEVDVEGLPAGWSEYSADVDMVDPAGRSCPHDPCFGEEVYEASPWPALELVEPS